MEEFKKLGLSEESIKVLIEKGYTKPTKIQARAIPLLLEGKKDIVGQSQTGTGKTAVFALPIIESIKSHSSVQAIILTPTRELALQVSKEFDSLKGSKDITVLAVYGGDPIGPQRQKLRRGVDIVVGTPGRVMDLQRRKSLKLDRIRYAVLDEADEMLNMGFVEDIETILENSPKNKKMLLFSATIPKQILNIAKKYMRDFELIEIEKAQVITKTVDQIYYEINARDRIEGLRRIFDHLVDFYGIVFCNTKATVDNLTQQLTKMGYSAAALHGDITQSQREKILQQFRSRHVNILVATDVAARGIDVDDLTHVINFSLPQSPESYVHRIGRTGRAGKKGISITFVIPSERRMLKFVERKNKCKIEKRKLPTPKQIIANKEIQIKTLLNSIMTANTGKSSKYKDMAQELLKEHEPAEIISAVLKYSFKNELNSSYRIISEPAQETYKSKPRKKRGSNNNRSKKRTYQKKYQKKIGSSKPGTGRKQGKAKKKFGKSGFRYGKRRK